ncbi:GDSL-like Lipase/Acylhydrolase [Biscogniauxia marginata]|nr:GDSL-like Lipase/Acylhydrolase [Biscogniauxia marginata]
MAAATPAKPLLLRILCFGNSLTCGYRGGNPYAVKLKERLEEELNAAPTATSASSGGSSSGNNNNKRKSINKNPVGGGRGGGSGAGPREGRKKEKEKESSAKMIAVECVVEGLPGDLVTRGKFTERMEERWAEQSYDWTIVLGGTNDLGWGVPEDQIIEGLKRAWDVPLSRGGKVLALTIPETKYRSTDLDERRGKVNAAIKAYKKTNFFHFDLHTALPYHAMPGPDRATYWDPDGVHLSNPGYDLMGSRVADALVRIVRLAEAQDTDLLGPLDARQRRAIEDLIFEEERGDPRLLSQGYIVVRRKDLD